MHTSCPELPAALVALAQASARRSCQQDREQAWIEKLRTPGRKASDLGFYAEPPIGIEPMTYSLRGHCLGRWWSLIVV